MPHVTIKHFPHDFTEEQKTDLARTLTAVVQEHFDVPADVVSIALEPVPQPDWEKEVRVPEITGREHLLIKFPHY